MWRSGIPVAFALVAELSLADVEDGASPQSTGRVLEEVAVPEYGPEWVAANRTHPRHAAPCWWQSPTY